MNDRELLELIATQVGTITTNVDNLTVKVNNVIKDVAELKEGQVRIENKIDDMESNNADRHLTINGDIRKIKSSLSKVEIVAADNWGDIARLKAKRRHRVK